MHANDICTYSQTISIIKVIIFKFQANYTMWVIGRH